MSGSRSRSRSRDRNPIAVKKIYISNLNPEATETDLRGKFEEFGAIDRVDIKKKGDDITFAFIEYMFPKDAEKAIDALNRTDFQGRTLKVELAKGPSGNNRFEGGRGGFRGGRGGDRGGFRPREGGRDFGGGYGGDRPPRSEIKCYNCQGIGHMAKDCTRPRQFSGGYRGNRDRPTGGSYGGRDRDRDYKKRSRSRSGSRSDSGDNRRRRNNDRDTY